jgi:hypothetical protein
MEFKSIHQDRVYPRMCSVEPAAIKSRRQSVADDLGLDSGSGDRVVGMALQTSKQLACQHCVAGRGEQQDPVRRSRLAVLVCSTRIMPGKLWSGADGRSHSLTASARRPRSNLSLGTRQGSIDVGVNRQPKHRSGINRRHSRPYSPLVLGACAIGGERG